MDKVIPGTSATAAETTPDLFKRVEALAADFATRAATHDRDGSFPFENFTALHSAQLLTLTIPREFGGQGQGLATVCRTIEKISGGDASTARDWLTGYLNKRSPSNLGASLATLPRFQAAVGDIEALLYANQRLIYGLALDIDRGEYDQGVGSQAQTVKYLTTNNAIRAVEIGLALIRNPGLSRSNPLERHYRDVLCSRIHTKMILSAHPYESWRLESSNELRVRVSKQLPFLLVGILWTGRK